MPLPHRAEALSDDACLTSVASIGPKSRTERPRKTKIGTEVAHVTRHSDTTFKVKRSKINFQRVGAYCGGHPHSLLLLLVVAVVVFILIITNQFDYTFIATPKCRRPRLS